MNSLIEIKTTNELIGNLNSEGKEHGTIKELLKNFILPQPNMAINLNDKCVYTIPVNIKSHTKINQAKQAFLKSTVNTHSISDKKEPKYEPTLHYAQIAVTTESEDTRSTGGGNKLKPTGSTKNIGYGMQTEAPQLRKNIEQHPRKVSFKIRNTMAAYKRQPVTTKTMTIASTKVSELTKKFNNLVIDSHNGSTNRSKLAKTIEDLQSASKCSVSNSSTPSSTLSSSPNIKIVFRHRRGSKKRNSRKRCSSMDSADKLQSSDSTAKSHVIRSKSDGNKIPKSPKKRLKNQSSSEHHSGSDSVDGNPTIHKVNTSKEEIKRPESIVVKNVIKKFECEITAQTVANNTLKRQNNQNKTPPPIKEKPKVPEKKSSLVVTKNLVVRDGVPKIKTIKPSVLCDIPPKRDFDINIENHKKKEPLYDKKKYKTNYIHSEKLPLKAVEIIQEDVNETTELTNLSTDEKLQAINTKEEETNQTGGRGNSHATPNESFLWRRKSSTQIYSDSEKFTPDSPYSFINAVVEGFESTANKSRTYQEIVSSSNVETKISIKVESQDKNQTCEKNRDTSLDFESDLVEAYNKDVLVGFTSKPKKEEVAEDDYEPLELKDNISVVPVMPPDRNSKLNCPLPEIPKEETVEPPKRSLKENIYQSLLEMRSHPEGDESSIHSYELYDSQLEERTRGDGDSDDGYEYCKSPIKPYCLTSSSGIQIAEDYKPDSKNNNKNYIISKSVSGTSTVSYEKIGSDRVYERIPLRPPKSKNNSPSSNRNSIISSDYTGYNDSENIYDTIRHNDGVSLSHCYESIPNSPNVVKLRNDLKKQLASAVQKRLSFDAISNVSQSTLSSEQKTNSIYGQRSVISYNGQEIAFQVPSSETSVSDRSDRSDDWVDVSDEEKTDEQKIIIVRERSRGRKSPVSWSQKVRHQWQTSPKQTEEDQVFITSPTNIYIDTSAKSPHYSTNDEETKNVLREFEVDNEVIVLKALEPLWLLSVRTVLRDGDFEVQDLNAFIDCDSSDSGHLYESLEPSPPHPPAHTPHTPIEEDFDSFDSDTDSDDHEKTIHKEQLPSLPTARLPSPPSGQYTLTKIANAAQKKMRQLKRNLTKRYSVAMDGKSFMKSPSTAQTNATSDGTTKTKNTVAAPIYANHEKLEECQHTYTNLSFNDSKPVLNKTENAMKCNGSFKEELKTMCDKRHSCGDVPPPLPEKPPPEKPTTPTSENNKKDSGSLSRKTYFSFKSRFRRASSLAVDMNTDVPSALKITNSTFYLTDSMDGDSGFSNCSDTAPGSDTLSPTVPERRRDGTRLRPGWSESSPCLALERPSVPPPPPPVPAPTDLSAVNEELKRLLPTLSRKDKGPRTRTSWYAECGSDTTPIINANNTSWYAEAGLYQAGNISSSSGASSGSHPASPLPHSLFTHEPLYQFYNAAKVESVCRDIGDSDSDTYEPSSSTGSAASPPPPPPPRPSAMALVSPRGPARTLWCEVPEVVNSAVLSSLAPAQKRLQEAKFELLTSEASYLNSLNVLEAHFIAHPAFRETHIMPRADWETLFSTILPVRRCSQLLMNELEKCWQENILLHGICDIVQRHAEKHFQVYVKYCENQALMVKALMKLRDRPTFAAALRKMESHPACQSLSLHSFLMLPMQRVTRLPLLVDAVLRHLASTDHEYSGCVNALATLNNFVSECNEGARNTERVEEMFRVSHSIEFPPNIRNAPVLGPACGRRDRRPVRWLVRSGEMTQLIWKTDELKLTFGKKFSKIPLHLFLFNDLLVITKKKGEGSFVAVEYCPRSLLEVCASDGAGAAKHALLLTLLENHEGRTVEMLLSCANETDASRWSEALCPPGGGADGGEGEAVYAGWDCPQVAALFAYTPAQPDELPLAEGDVVNVTRKTSEGWYYGERTRDGECGWFPGAYTAEIASPHVRARNLRQRYRLLALSGTYLGQKKRL